MTPESKYKGSIKLSAIGDALGWITEFEKSQNALLQKYGTDYISRFYDWKKMVGGRFNGYLDNINAGDYSDDTQLMLSVARSIKSNGQVNHEYFANVELPSWLQYSRGAGRTIKNAARKIQRKSANWNSNFFTYNAGKTTIDYRDSGANGAAMRVLPIALANFAQPEKIKEEIFSNSISTHGHPRAIIGAILHGIAVNTILLYKPEDFDPILFVTKLGKDLHQQLSNPIKGNLNLEQWELKWNEGRQESFSTLYEEILNETQEYLRDLYKFLQHPDSDTKILKAIGCYAINTKGSGTSTVIAGIYFTCRYHNDPIKAITKAANSIGTDTDSIAAFTGGLVGALHGQGIIPKKLGSVQDSQYLDRLARHLLSISEQRINKRDINHILTYEDLNIENDSYSVKDLIMVSPLGKGEIISIDRQDTLTKGRYNLILKVEFEIGQTCVFSKLLSKESHSTSYSNRSSHDIPHPSLKDEIEAFRESLSESQKMAFDKLLKNISI